MAKLRAMCAAEAEAIKRAAAALQDVGSQIEIRDRNNIETRRCIASLPSFRNDQTPVVQDAGTLAKRKCSLGEAKHGPNAVSRSLCQGLVYL